MGVADLSYRARNALAFLAQHPSRWFAMETANEEALEMFEELEDANLIDVRDQGNMLFMAINANGAVALGYVIQ